MRYLVAQAAVTGCLAVGTPVVVDAVSPVAEARAGWRTAAAAASAPVHVFEVVLNDLGEHRWRVEQRRNDLEGLVVPTWDQVRARNYQPWDVHRDGNRRSSTAATPKPPSRPSACDSAATARGRPVADPHLARIRAGLWSGARVGRR